MNLDELLARRAQLLAELEKVNKAIAAFGDAGPCSISTAKNLRNTPCVSVEPKDADRYLVVFSDPGMTRPADRQDHGGYVSKAAWTKFQMEHPDLIEHDFIWEDK